MFMKKLIFMFSVLFGTMFISCGVKTESTVDSVVTDTVSVDTVTVDTVAVDTIQ